jgi:hypothetical protein
MPKPIAISGTNVKGRDFAHRLEPVNIITGDNFSGKSAIIEAYRVGLLGYLPRLGKQPSSTFTLAGAHKAEMEITLQFEGDLSIRRKWMKKKESVSLAIDDVPQSLIVPPVLMDIRDYFARTRNDRVRFIIDKVDINALGLSDESVIERLNTIEVVPAAASIAAKAKMQQIFERSIADRKRTNQMPQAWLDSLMISFQNEQKENKIGRDQKSKEIAGIKSNQPTVPPKDVSADIKSKRGIVDGIRQDIALIEKELDSYNRNVERRTELISATKAPVAEPKDLAEQIKEIDKAIATIDDGIKSVDAKLAKLRPKWGSANTSLKTAKANTDDVHKRIKELSKLECCPFCKGAQENWKASLLGGYQDEFDKAALAQAAAFETLTKIENESKAETASKAEYEKQRKELGTKRATLNSRYTTEMAAFNTYNQNVAELKGMNASAPQPDVVRLTDLKSREAIEAAELGRLEPLDRDFSAYKNARESMKKLEATMLEFQGFEEFFKKCAAEILAVQQDFVGIAFGGILEKARALTDGILRAPLEFRDGDLGMTVETGWVSHEVFSGTEEALAYAAFSVALAQQAPIKVVLIDEMDRLRGDRRKMLVERMLELTSKGVIDQFIGVSIDPAIYDSSKVNIIRVE